MIMKTLCAQPLAMKHFGAVSAHYVVCRLQYLLRVAIHLGVHNHHVVNGKCQEFIQETKRLIVKEVDRKPNAKISSISFIASKTFLANYLFDDSSDGKMELLKGEQLEHI